VHGDAGVLLGDVEVAPAGRFGMTNANPFSLKVIRPATRSASWARTKRSLRTRATSPRSIISASTRRNSRRCAPLRRILSASPPAVTDGNRALRAAFECVHRGFIGVKLAQPSGAGQLCDLCGWWSMLRDAMRKRTSIRRKIAEAVRLLLEGIGEDTNGKGCLETPERVARMYEEIFGAAKRSRWRGLSKQFDEDHPTQVQQSWPAPDGCASFTPMNLDERIRKLLAAPGYHSVTAGGHGRQDAASTARNGAVPPRAGGDDRTRRGCPRPQGPLRPGPGSRPRRRANHLQRERIRVRHPETPGGRDLYIARRTPASHARDKVLVRLQCETPSPLPNSKPAGR